MHESYEQEKRLCLKYKPLLLIPIFMYFYFLTKGKSLCKLLCFSSFPLFFLAVILMRVTSLSGTTSERCPMRIQKKLSIFNGF